MRKYILKKLILSIYFIIVSFVFIAITFPVMEMKIFPNYFTIDLCYILAIATISFALPLILQSIGQLVILIVEFAILISSASLYLSRGDVFTWSLISQIGQLKNVSDMIKIPIPQLIIGIALIIGFIILFTIFIINTKKIRLKKFYNWLTAIVLLGCLGIASAGNIIIHHHLNTKYRNDLFYSSASYMYKSFNSPYASLQNFGVFGYYFEDLFRRLIPSWKPVVADNNFISSYSYEHYSSVLDGLCRDNNVIMISAESFDNYAITKEITPVLYSLKNGANLNLNGIQEFYNIINEDGETKITRKDFDYDGSTYTYNNIDIYNNTNFNDVGIVLSNYVASETTNISESKLICGYYSHNFVHTPYTLPNLLENYTSTYLHGFWGNFYNRNTRITSLLGFDRALFLEDMEDFQIGNKEFVSGDINVCSLDSLTLKHYTDNNSEYNIFPTDKKFLTFFMTVTTHGAFSYSPYLDDNYILVDAIIDTFNTSEVFKLYNSLDNELKSSVREYYARALDTEYALAYLVNYLHNNNILDKTIITFTGDHKIYSNNLGNFKKLYTEKILHLNPGYYNNTVEGFIYSTQIKNSYLSENGENRNVSHLTESIDLVPTILSLLGYRFNQDLFTGYAVINKSVTHPAKTIYNELSRSFAYGYLFNEKYLSYDGIDVLCNDSSHTPSNEEINEFVYAYNNNLKKDAYVTKQRSE